MKRTTQIVSFWASEKKREKILTFGPLEVLFTSPSKIREARPKPQGTAGRRTKKPQATGADAP